MSTVWVRARRAAAALTALAPVRPAAARCDDELLDRIAAGQKVPRTRLNHLLAQWRDHVRR